MPYIPALLRKKLRAFRLWGVLTQELRDVEVSNEQARLLVYAKVHLGHICTKLLLFCAYCHCHRSFLN
jgi:hypothetical protein